MQFVYSILILKGSVEQKRLRITDLRSEQLLELTEIGKLCDCYMDGLLTGTKTSLFICKPFQS